MAKSNLMPNPYQPDPETLGETLRNLGVTVEKPNQQEITNIKWVDGPNTQKNSKLITVTQKAIYFPGIMNDLTRVALGTAQYDGKMILVIKHDPKGYKPGRLTARGTRRYSIPVKRVVSDLIADGLKPGYYEPVKVKNGWMGVPQ